MRNNRIRVKCVLAPILLAFAGTAFGAAIENPLAFNACGAYDGALASTCMFSTGNAGNTGTPISAETDFVEDWDTIGFNGLTLATHELFHAIGFTTSYANFAAKVFATPGAGMNGIPANSRVYSTNGLVGGILMVLTPDTKANPLGTHADAGATGAAPWPATGYNQANDIMQPFLPPSTSRTLSATDFSVLADAFGWNRTGIRIFINNIGGTMDDTDLNILANAAAAITAQYGSFGNSPSFTWNVAEVAPEPSTWLTGFLGGAFLIAVVRRRAAS